jgi:hypothetical protein
VIGVGYLPTNPDWMVHDIVTEKSTCLQSAAKVPLFVSVSFTKFITFVFVALRIHICK